MFIYKKATIDDLDFLIRTRIEVLRAANHLADDVDMSHVEQESHEYYKASLPNDTHVAYLIFDNDIFVGCGGISFYTVMPTYHNPSGRKAYIMNMYTRQEYRRRGIAYHTLDLLVKEANSRDIHQVALEATEIGRKLYEKYGFINASNEMELL